MLLINFDDKDVQTLTTEGFDVQNVMTRWNGGSEDINPTSDTNIVFINGTFGDSQSSSLHSDNFKAFQKYIQNGGIVVTFINGSQQFHMQNLIGLTSEILFEHRGGQPKTIKAKDSNFLPIFSRYGNRIVSSMSLIRGSYESNILDNHAFGDSFELLAYQQDIRAVVSLKYQLGRGFYLFLPYFNLENISVIKLLTKDILPKQFPELFEQPVESWTKKEDYQLPEIIKAQEKIDELDKTYKTQRENLDNQYNDIWVKEQEPYLKLITSQGEELKEAVANLFREFGYFVVDVDKFMKEKGLENSLDEDLWLLGEEVNDFNLILSREDLKLVEVKGIKHVPKDDDVTAITKYVRKRIRETKNSQIKGLFVVNHSMGIPAFERQEAFRKMLKDNAADAGELLISTDVLFRFIKAFKSGELSKEKFREVIDSTSGALIYENKIQESSDEKKN